MAASFGDGLTALCSAERTAVEIATTTKAIATVFKGHLHQLFSDAPGVMWPSRKSPPLQRSRRLISKKSRTIRAAQHATALPGLRQTNDARSASIETP